MGGDGGKIVVTGDPGEIFQRIEDTRGGIVMHGWIWQMGFPSDLHSSTPFRAGTFGLGWSDVGVDMKALRKGITSIRDGRKKV